MLDYKKYLEGIEILTEKYSPVGAHRQFIEYTRNFVYEEHMDEFYKSFGNIEKLNKFDEKMYKGWIDSCKTKISELEEKVQE